MRCSLLWIASAAAHGLLSRHRAPVPPVTIHAHLTAQDALTAGVAASAAANQAEHAHLEEVIASLHDEIAAEELARAAKPVPPPPKPTPPPLPALLPSPVPPLTEVLAERRLHQALRVILDNHVNTTTQLVARVATIAGEKVARAAAEAAAQHAAEVAAKELVKFACDFAAHPAPDAAAAGALSAANTSWATADQKQEAQDLARGAAADEVASACMDEAMPLLEYAQGNATEKATEDATTSAVLAASAAAHKAAHPAAARAADWEYDRVVVAEEQRLRNFSRAAALRALANDNATDPAYPTGRDQVRARTEHYFEVAEAAAKVVAGAERVAAAAALRAAAPDIPERVARAVSMRRKHINQAVANETAAILLAEQQVEPTVPLDVPPAA